MDANMCIDSMEVFVYEPTQFLAGVFPIDTFIVLGESVELLTFPNQPLSSVTWTPADYLSCDTCLNPIASPVESTTYLVEMVNTDSCTFSTEVLIRLDKQKNVFIPNVFSPNGDGYNDFVTVYSDSSVVRVRTIKIFDRWGEIIYVRDNFLTNEILSGWDGTFNGKKMNPAVFIFLAEIEFIDGSVEVFKGDITLVR
jgi:gliding motility-associated-like protein